MKKSTFLRKLLSAVCCLAMLVTMLPIVPAAAADNTLLIAPNPNAGAAVSGGSLSSFSDAAEITYTKAAEVTAGLKLFEGAGGKFMPKSNLTRAQMATIIVKMLNGSDANADAFKGTGKFSDTAIFEGGWAEGYINWCATLGIVSGYGDGTFKPGNKVTAAEAATMILNALKVDAGEGEWPHTVMAKAEELDMFDDLSPKPANDQALTREELAVMALVGLEYSPEGTTGYEYNGVVYDSYFDALLVAGDASKITPAAKDTLASKVFDMKIVEGFVTGNQATGLDFTELNGAVPFAIETGLEHIGHYVTVYYAEEYESEDEPGLTYTVYDETKVYEVKDEDVDTAKEYKELFGKNIRVNSSGVALFDGQYVMTDADAADITGYVPGSYAPMGTYFVYEGAVVAYMEPVTVYASKVSAVNNYEGSESVTLKGVMAPIPNAENDDCVVEYKGIAKDDYVTYTIVGSGADAIYVLTKATPVTGTVTKITTNENGQRVVTLKGEQYVAFGTANNAAGLETADVTDFAATYTFYVTADGKYVGWEKSDGAADLTNAVFVLGELPMDKADAYGKITRTVYARGVDMDGKEVMLPVKIVKGEYNKANKDFDSITETITDPNCAAVTANTFYYVKDATDRDAKKEGLKILTAITSEYDEKEMPLYYGSANTANGSQFTQNVTVNGETAFRKSSTLNITVDGDLYQSTPLTATVKKGNMNGVVNNTGSTVKRHILLSRDGLSTYLEVIVICQNGMSEVLSAETVYVSDVVAENAAVDVNGYVFDVYDYSTGAAKQITLEKKIDEYDTYEGAGYYNLMPVTGSEAFSLGKKITGSAFAGNAGDTATDGLYYENVAYDQVLTVLSTSYFSTISADTGAKGVSNGSGAAKAVVIDLRTEEDIVAHGVGKIDSVARIADLILENDQIIIPFDLCYSTNKDTLLTVFVKDLYYSSLNTGVELVQRGEDYYLNGYPVAADAVVSGAGVTSVDEIYDLLNPEAAAPGYPPNEPAEVELTFTLSGGKITEIVVTKALAAGVYCVDDFESYSVGDFHNNSAALEKGWAFTGDEVETIVREGGNQYLAIDSARPKIRPAGSTIPEDSFTLKFDFKRTADVSGTLYVNLCHYSDGSNRWINFVAYDNGSFGLIDTYAAGGQNVVALDTGKLKTAGVQNNGVAGIANAAKLDKNVWYTVEVTIDYDNGNVVLKVAERDDATEILCNDSRALDSRYGGYAVTFDAQTIAAFGGGVPSMGIDNISYTAVSDWEYPITVDQPEGAAVSADKSAAATGETVTLSCTPDNAQEYALAYFTVNGQPIEGNTFVMGTDPVTVSAVLERSYAITVTQPTGVTIQTDVAYAAEGATVTLTGTLTGGYYAFETVTVTGAGGSVPATIDAANGLKATFTMPAEAVAVSVTLKDTSVVLEDDFSGYTGTAFNDSVAKAHGYTGMTSGTMSIENETLKVSNGRGYLQTSNSIPTAGTYSFSFDLKRTGSVTGAILRLGSKGPSTATGYSGGNLRLCVESTTAATAANSVYLQDQVTGKKNYLTKSNTFVNSYDADTCVTMPLDEWWTLEAVVDTTGSITIKVGKVGATTYSATYNVGSPVLNVGKNGCGLFDLNTNSGAGVHYVDNVKIVRIWEG